MVDGQVVASAVDGERKRGSGVPIELGDRWHVDSVTKSVTATMIARLIESGQMQWSDSVGQRFPDAAIHEDWKPVTLRQLLTHTAGAPGNFSVRVRLKRPLHVHNGTPAWRARDGHAARRRNLQTAPYSRARQLCMRLGKERSDERSPAHHLLAQWVKYDVVRAGRIHP
jgi:CubicO group peptidase (beta-lactamase class C family)